MSKASEFDLAEIEIMRQQAELLKANARLVNAQAETQEKENKKTRRGR